MNNTAFNTEYLVAKYSIKTFSLEKGENVEGVAFLRHTLALVEKYDSEKNDAIVVALAHLLKIDESIFDEYLRDKIELGVQGSPARKRIAFLAIKAEVEEVKL